MGTGLRRALGLWLAVWLLPALLPGLEILDPKEVEYVRTRVEGAVGGSVTLDCGPTLPSVFIWGYAPPGANDSGQAVAYNYGQGPKVQQPPGTPGGEIRVAPNSSSLVIDALLPSAAGLYTCQALYDAPDGPKVAFHYVQLDVLDGDGEPGSAQV